MKDTTQSRQYLSDFVDITHLGRYPWNSGQNSPYQPHKLGAAAIAFVRPSAGVQVCQLINPAGSPKGMSMPNMGMNEVTGGNDMSMRCIFIDIFH